MNADELQSENSLLRSALQESNAARDAALARVEELAKYEPRMRSLHCEGGAVELQMEPNEALQFLSDCCVKLLEGAPNFSTSELLLRQTKEQFNITVERVGGKSLAKTLAELRATIARVREIAIKYRDWPGALDPMGPLHGVGMQRAFKQAGEEFLAIVGEA